MCSFVQTLVAAYEASIEAPFATTRIHIALADEYLQLVVVEAEDNAVNGQQHFLEFRIIRCHCCLPEVDVECYGETKDDDGVEYIPLVPAGTGSSNLLGSRRAEYQALNLLLVGSLCQQ